MQTAWRERNTEARIKAAREAIALNPECATVINHDKFRDGDRDIGGSLCSKISRKKCNWALKNRGFFLGNFFSSEGTYKE